MIKSKILADLCNEHHYACGKHNWIEIKNKDAFQILENELNELARAMLTEDKRQIYAESLHVATVALRIAGIVTDKE